jgi:hypothetical protein
MSKTFHGDPKRGNHFWLYPHKLTNLHNSWDTDNLNSYCNNHRYCHHFLHNNVAEYECLGHDINEDILLAILVKDKGPCLPFYLQCIYNLNYDKKKLHLYIRTNDNNDNSAELLLEFIGKYGNEYGSVYYDDSSLSPRLKTMGHRDWNSHRFDVLGQIRQDSINYAEKNGWHYFVADCDNFITPNTLKTLLAHRDYKVIGPLLPTKTGYSNYHYDVDGDGYYAHNPKYMDILHKKMCGIFPVAVIHCTYFINHDTLKDIKYNDGTGRHEYVIFSDVLRKKNIKQYIINNDFFGMLTCHTNEEALKKDLKEYWDWALPAFKISDDYFN